MGTNLDEVTPTEAYKATAYSVAERLIDVFDKTNEYWAYVFVGWGVARAWGSVAASQMRDV